MAINAQRVGFKTAYLQKSDLVKADVIATATDKVLPMTLVTLAGTAQTDGSMVYTITIPTLATALANATHIIAAGDISTKRITANRNSPRKHIDKEIGRYQVGIDYVQGKATGGSNVKVAVYRITDPLDIVLTEQYDTSTVAADYGVY